MSVSPREILRKEYQDACRERIIAQLRQQRPLPTRYLLEQAVMYHSLEYKPDEEKKTTPAGLVQSPDPAFVHASVQDWIRDNGLEWVTTEFYRLGIYDHQDLANVACGIRSPPFRHDLLWALDASAYDSVTLETALRRYARPVKYPLVKSSQSTPRVEQGHEYLFNTARWHRRLMEVDAEVKQRHREREVWIDTVMDGEDDNGGVDEEVKLKKEEIKTEDMEVAGSVLSDIGRSGR